MTQTELTQAVYRALAKTVWLVVAVLAVTAFLDAITTIVLFFLLAIVISIAITPPVNWLETRKIPRVVATVGVLICILGAFIGLFAITAPRLAGDLQLLGEQLPDYSRGIAEQVEGVLSHFPEVGKRLRDPGFVESLLPSASGLISRVGRYSITAATLFFGGLVLLALVAYIVASPRPLLRGVLSAVPAPYRDRFSGALSEGSRTVSRWVWANAIIGAIEAVLAVLFLSWLGIPGAFLWGLVTFFGELVPQLGSYLMAVPPLIVALAIDPSKALWVLVFYIVLQQFVNNVLAPPIRASTMKIHPVSEIFAVLALTAGFGVLGAFLADPLVGFVKAFYNAFYGDRNQADTGMDERVEMVLHARAPGGSL